ncbi:MAG TPA: DinB family protein [Streptosporangiaceae bacterium]|nr:DinB family protein [Streptosporangiaceae bacterium]
MEEDARSPAELAAAIGAARDRLIGFVRGCTDEQWRSAPLDGDPRPVGVVVDHVAHSYEYLGGWIHQLVAGRPVDVNNEVVDALNAEHAQAAASVSRADATAHLLRSGDAIGALIAGLSTADLEAGGGRVRRFAQIAIRHPDDHRSEIETALAGQAAGRS